MNSRDYKTYYPGGVYHVYNRGVDRGFICRDDQDYRNFIYRFLLVLGLVPVPKRTTKGGLQIKPVGVGKFEVLSYCIMPNHFHFLLKQLEQVDPEMLFRKALTSYVRYFNLKYERVGHLFQDIFKCKQVYDDPYLLHLSAYIHNNPTDVFGWKYSSLQHYIGEHHDELVSDTLLNSMLPNPNGYKDFFLNSYSPDLVTAADLHFEED